MNKKIALLFLMLCYTTLMLFGDPAMCKDYSNKPGGGLTVQVIQKGDGVQEIIIRSNSKSKIRIQNFDIDSHNYTLEYISGNPSFTQPTIKGFGQYKVTVKCTDYWTGSGHALTSNDVVVTATVCE